MTKTIYALAIAGLLAIAPAASADEFVIEPAAAARPEMPARGMTMDRVRNRFGAPQSVSGPIGEPPITRWDYDRFIVVFEHRHVVHSVVKREIPPRPAS